MIPTVMRMKLKIISSTTLTTYLDASGFYGMRAAYGGAECVPLEADVVLHTTCGHGKVRLEDAFSR